MLASVQDRGSMNPRPKGEPNETTYAGRLGASIRTRREQIGMSVAELAQAIGVSEAAIYEWERARRKLNIDYLPAIAAALRTTVKKLMP